MNILFGTVFYAGAERFAKDFLFSLEKQTYPDFKLLVINNSGKDVRKIFPGKYPFPIFIKDVNKLSIAGSRSALLREAHKLKADLLVCGDIDDYFSNNRIGLCARRINSFDFLYNDIILVDRRARIISNRGFIKKSLQKTINDYRVIVERNFLGMSNICLNLKKLDLSRVKVPGYIRAVDWWLMTKLLLDGKRGGFVKGAYTYYRQHSGNLIGARARLDLRSLKMGLNVKRCQYKYFLRYHTDYKLRYAKVVKLEERLKNKTAAQEYIQSVNNKFKKSHPVWWENIVLN